MENTYIRVFGQARHQDVKPFIMAFKVEPVVNPNAIYEHLLSVIYDSKILEMRKKASMLMETNESMEAMNGFMPSANGAMSGFTDVQRRVLDVMKKYGATSPLGLTRNEIKNHLIGVTASAISEAIDVLVNEGHMFTTSDDDTFKATDSYM